MHIIKAAEWKHVERYGLEYAWNDDPLAGFAFDCDVQGNILLDQLQPEAAENLRKCQDGTYAVTCKGIQDYSYNFLDEAVGQCLCGRQVALYGFTNPCECGLAYNSCGQLLAPRSQW